MVSPRCVRSRGRWRRGGGRRRPTGPIRSAAAAGGLALDGRDLAGLHELLEAAEVFADLVVGVLAEEPGDGHAEPAPAGGS